MGLDENETNAKNRTLRKSASELTNSLEMVKKRVRLWNRSILMSEVGVKPKFTILGLDEHETDAKNRTSRNSSSELTNPLEMVKKHVRLRNRSIMVSELGVRSKLRIWRYMSTKQTRKIGL